MRLRPVFLSIAPLLCATALGQILPYQDPKLPFTDRVNDLVGRMTLDEKISQMMHGAKSIPRLGIPEYNWWNEALHGVARNGIATSFPQAIGRGASFDPDLEHRIAIAISDEARAKNNDAMRRGIHDIYTGLTFWSPNINIFRDPRWGRGQETFGEDPYLTARMGVSFVKGMQGDDPKYLKTVATPKHFAVHSGPEPLRNRFNAEASKQDMFATYLPAFQACVQEGGAWSVMAAYNRVNGVPCSGNSYLLDEVLRKKWGFKGYVVSDCGAINNIFQDHHYVKTAEEAAALAVNAGCDLECGDIYQALVRAVQQKKISEETINQSVKRLFEARFRLGMFDPPSAVPYTNIPMSVVDSPEHRKLALDSAHESIVLLKNSSIGEPGPILPFRSNVRTIAVIGPNANDQEVLLGNYNGQPSHVVTPLEGIRKAAAATGVKVLYSKGCDINAIASLTPIPSTALRSGTTKEYDGLRGEYFDNTDLKGRAVLVRGDPNVDFDWDKLSPGKEVPREKFSVRWRGFIVAPATGDFTLATTSDDGVKLYIDKKLVIDNWTTQPRTTNTATISMIQGKRYAVRLDYFQGGGDAGVQLKWAPPSKNDFQEALDVANQADVVVACLGINGSLENEGTDRASLDLPGAQEKMLEAISETGKPVVLVLVNGSPMSVNWASEHVPAILESWYGGQEGGQAIADVLFGQYNPGGRLPITFPTSANQVPEFTSYAMKGRTYRYMTAKPLYPFGFGLSYTAFKYANLQVPKSAKLRQPFAVTVDVQNTGTVDGDEVAQLYTSRLEGDNNTPIRELKNFVRVHIKAGETVRVTFNMTPEALTFVDEKGGRAYLPGSYRISVGTGQPDAPNGMSYLPGHGGYRTMLLTR